MKVYIRTNFNNKIGLGHFSRCSRLANFFAEKKLECEIYLDNNSQLNNFFSKNKKIKIKNLYKDKKKFINQTTDANLFLKHLGDESIVIVDDYRLDYRWEEIVLTKAKKIIVIEDQNIKTHNSNYIINSNPKFSEKDNYTKLNKNQNCRYLLGPNFSIIDKKKNLSKKNLRFKNLAFYFGGSGDLIYFYKILFFMSNNKMIPKDVKINFIVGPLSKNVNKILELSKKIKYFKVYKNLPNLNNILSNTDLLISSSGMITNEAALYKVPLISFMISKNQVIEDKYLENLGMYFNLKLIHLKKVKKITELILLMINNIDQIKKTYKSKINFKENRINNIYKSIILDSNPNTINKLSTSKKTDKKLIQLDNLAINEYMHARNQLINRKNSHTIKTIDRLDHYLWWLKSKKVISALRILNNFKLFIKNEIISLKSFKLCVSGFVVCNKSISGLDVIWSLNKNIEQIKLKYNKIYFMSIVKKRNKFANLHTKYIGLSPYKGNNIQINEFLKTRKVNLSKLNVYINN